MKTTPDYALRNGTALKATYQITEFMSSGGFGITYKARHVNLPYVYVIKEFFISGKCLRKGNLQTLEIQGISLADFVHFKAAFLEEAKTLAKLRENEHIVNVEDYFEENATAYFVMPFVEADDLEQYLRKQPYERLNEAQTITYTQQLCYALQAAHAQNIIHRDIKPANLLLTEKGKLILIDFGAAREFLAEGVTQTMTQILTPGYAPLEQYHYQDKRGATIDVYAVGALMYRMLTGKKPLEATQRAMGMVLENLQKLNPSLSTQTANVVMKAMEMKPENRFWRVSDLAKALVLEETPTIVEPKQQPKPKPQPQQQVLPKKEEKKQEIVPAKSKYYLSWTVGILGLIAALFGGYNWLFSEKETQQETNTLTENTVRPAPSPAKKGGDYTETVKGVSFTMKAIPAGTFTMGCTNEQGSDCSDDEKPAHSVALSAFYMLETEVTQKLWQAVMGNNPSHFKGDNLPVENISWNDAQEFIQKLNQLTGKKYALPSEAQWEYAAREGGKKVRFGNGKDIADANEINFDASKEYVKSYSKVGEYRQKTVAVNRFAPSKLGLYNMSGNVWEWCQDVYAPYASSSQTNPIYTGNGSFRVVRGGSWGSSPQNLRCADRYSVSPDLRYYSIGFRLSRTE